MDTTLKAKLDAALNKALLERGMEKDDPSFQTKQNRTKLFFLAVARLPYPDTSLMNEVTKVGMPTIHSYITDYFGGECKPEGSNIVPFKAN